MLPISLGVGEEWGIGKRRYGSEKATGLGEGDVDREREGGEEIEKGETEELGLQEKRGPQFNTSHSMSQSISIGGSRTGRRYCDHKLKIADGWSLQWERGRNHTPYPNLRKELNRNETCFFFEFIRMLSM